MDVKRHYNCGVSAVFDKINGNCIGGGSEMCALNWGDGGALSDQI
jgi:hypothetical protein